MAYTGDVVDLAFQSTLPVWGATGLPDTVEIVEEYFNPRSPCGERPSGLTTSALTGRFQSTLPVWGATMELARGDRKKEISIHAPRVGSDLVVLPEVARHGNFNPRSPCGERRGAFRP